MTLYPSKIEPCADLTVEDCQAIIEHVWNLVGHTENVLDMLRTHDSQDTPALDAELQHLFERKSMYGSETLAAYLRYSSIHSEKCPHWPLLLDAAYKQCVERNSPEYAHCLFAGMI